MRLHFSARNVALGVLLLAFLILSGSIAYNWYTNRKNFYTAGSPPQDILQRVEPKSVPYDSIKPPAINAGETFLVGSVTSSYYGVIFFGDYTDSASAKAFKETLSAIQAYKGKVRLVWRQLPASTEDGSVSFEAAVASECSRLMNPSWPAHQAMLDASAQGLTKSKIDDIVDRFDVNQMLNMCRDDATVRKSVRTAIERYRGDGIDTAPFVFVGTQVYPAAKATPTAVVQAIRNMVK